MLKRTYTAIFLALLFSFTVQAQTSAGTNAGMSAGLDYESGLTTAPKVSHYRGSVAIAVPLYSLASAGLTMPIGLQYNASGVKVENNRGGLVGLNWTLQAGGELVRQPHSQPDEWKNVNSANSLYAGYMRIGQYCNANSAYGICQVDRTVWNAVGSTLSASPDVYNRFCKAFWVSHKRDRAPDEFEFRALGRQVKFMFSEAGEIYATEAIRVDYTLGEFRDPLQRTTFDSVIINWRITLSDGTILVFGRPEATATRAAYYDGWPQTASSVMMNKWLLTQVISAQGQNAFTLSYSSPISEHRLCLADDHEVSGNGISPQILWLCKATELNPSGQAAQVHLVSQIETSTQRISFVYNYLSAVLGSRLTTVRVDTRTGEPLKKYELTYGTRMDDRRWVLEQVKEQSIDGTANSGKYRFEYNAQEIPFFNYRPYSSTADHTAGIDHWGYFNGVQPAYSSLIPTVPAIHPKSGQILPTIATRTPNPAAMKAMSLRKIWLPTGGFIEYDCEVV